MLTRRQVCLSALAAVALPEVTSAAATATAAAGAFEADLAVHDRRELRALRFAASMRANGVEVLSVGDDAAVPWEQRLRHVWNGADVTVIGMTTPAAAFCFDLMARDAGYRLVYQSAVDATDMAAFRDAARTASDVVHLQALPHAQPGGSLVVWIIRRRPRR